MRNGSPDDVKNGDEKHRKKKGKRKMSRMKRWLSAALCICMAAGLAGCASSEKAKDKAPCIVFIDEIDAVGRARGKNPNMGANDEREIGRAHV